MISQAFADVLAAGRNGFNHRVREAQRRFPAFRADAFMRFLEEGVDPVAIAIARVDRARMPVAVLAAFDVALELAGRSLVGPSARSQALAEAWRDLFPHLVHLIAAQPAQVLAMLSNAIVYIEGLGGARVAQWTEELAALAPHIESAGQLRIVGQVLAWRAGAAHYRSGVFAAASTLPEALALRTFGAGGWSGWESFRSDVEHDPWWGGSNLHAVSEHRVGSFSGFGGQFALPPEVRACGEIFFVKSSDRHFLLVADAYGAVLHAASAEEFEHAGTVQPHCDHTLREGMLLVGAQQIPLDVPASGLRVCATAATIAVVSPYTHTIRLLARSDR